MNTYFRSLDQVWTKSLLNWNYASPETIRIYFVRSAVYPVAGNQHTQRSFQLVAHHYELDKDILAVEQDMFKNFRGSNDDVRLESAVYVLGCMHENGLMISFHTLQRRWKFWASYQPLHAHAKGLSAPSGAWKPTSEAPWSSLDWTACLSLALNGCMWILFWRMTLTRSSTCLHLARVVRLLSLKT